MLEFANVYEDSVRAESYSKLEYPGTYYLAFRDLPVLFEKYASGNRALDFGCGAGRSTRFLAKHGFEVIGVDISPNMIQLAGKLDSLGDYRLFPDGDFTPFADESFDLIFSAFAFDNIPDPEHRIRLLKEMKRLLAPEGILINLVSSPEIYLHEWVSFSTKDFPENKFANDGDLVKIIMTDVEDRRPVEDLLWTNDHYQSIFLQAGLKQVYVHKPLGKHDEPIVWVNETNISPWVVYVLNK